MQVLDIIMDSKNQQHPNIEDWSDQKCLQIASQDQFPAIVKDLQVQKHIISRYLNFYLGGKVPKGLNARDLTLAVIAIMPISPGTYEEFIWPKSEYSENGTLFFLTPDDKLKYDVESVVKKRESESKGKDGENLNDKQFADGTDSEVEPFMNMGDGDVTNDNSESVHTPEREADTFNTENSNETVDQSEVGQDSDTSSNEPSHFKPTPVITTLKWYRLKRDEASTNPPNEPETEYGPVENAKFCTMCNRVLDVWESNAEARISLKAFFALVALLVMRSKAKTVQTLAKYFSKQFVDSFYPGRLNHYTTPHRGFIKKSWKVFRETDRKNEIMFAKLVITSLLYPTRLDKYGKNNILKFAVLSHTAYFGMGIINMLQQLASYNNDDFKIMFASMYSDETAASWKRVNDFFKKYLNEESKQHTFHWASIIESKTFKHLSCSNNYELAVVIAVFIEKITKNSGVWQSAWVSKGSHLEKCKQLGYKLYNDYQELQAKTLESLISELGFVRKNIFDIIAQ